MRDESGEKPELERFEQFESGHTFQVGDIAVKPFTIPHDAADPVGFTFRAEGIKMGIATDLGYIPVSVRDHLARVRCAGYGIESRSGDAKGGAVSVVS